MKASSLAVQYGKRTLQRFSKSAMPLTNAQLNCCRQRKFFWLLELNMTRRGRKRALSSILQDQLATMTPDDPKYFELIKWSVKATAIEAKRLSELRKLREGRKPKNSKASKASSVIGKMNPGAARYLEEQEKKNGEQK